MKLLNLFNAFENSIHTTYRSYGARKSARHYFRLLNEHGIQKKLLSNAQKCEIDNFWGVGGGYDTHELVYSVTGEFNARVCSEKLFRTKIELAINNQKLKHAWSDKNYFDLHFPNISFPVTVVRNINGNYFDKAYRAISRQEAKNIMEEYEFLVIKPALESGLGKNVRLINGSDLDAVITNYKTDFIIQEVVEQYEPLASLNPSSVNIVRIISLFINGRVSPVMAALRCGATGSFTDLSITADGRGTFIIGIEKNGSLKNRAVYSCGEMITESPNGVAFAGLRIPNFENILAITTEVHYKLAHFGFIGFDIAVDKNGLPVMMEFNLRGPGILYYQYVNGPLFGERTEEIISCMNQRGQVT